MRAQQLGKHFSPNIGWQIKELYSVAGLLFLQEFQSSTIPEAVEATSSTPTCNSLAHLGPGRDEMCDRTFERYRAVFSKTKVRGELCSTSLIASSICSNPTSPRYAWIRPMSSATWPRRRESAAGGHDQAVFDQVNRDHRADFEALPADCGDALRRRRPSSWRRRARTPMAGPRADSRRRRICVISSSASPTMRACVIGPAIRRC